MGDSVVVGTVLGAGFPIPAGVTAEAAFHFIFQK